MAKQTIVQIMSDISGEPDAVPVKFSFENTSYSIDLTTEERAEFAQALSRYIQAGTKTGGGAVRKGGRRSRSDLAEIRKWARENGHELSERGRIPNSVVAAYDAR